MIFIYIILTALVASAKGFMEYNISKRAQALQCVGALGEPLIFYLPTDATKIALIKDDTIILRVANNNVSYLHMEYQGTLFTNGTFKLDNARKRHSGDYVWEVFQSDGKLSHKLITHLEIQAPVSEPTVFQTCLSPEKMMVTCSSEGDVKEFDFSLDDYLLMQTKAHSQSLSRMTEDTPSLASNATEQDMPRVSHISISLYGQLTGNLMCNVQNNVSKEETVIQLTSCKASISHFPFMIVGVIASLTIPLLFLALFFGIKHLHKKTRPMNVAEGNAEDEIVYSDVVVMKNRRKNTPNMDQHAA